MWTINSEEQFVFNVYSERESLDPYSGLILSPPESLVKNINNFSQENAILKNTEIINDLESGEDISLKLPDKTISFVLDKSGSQSINDPNDYRINIIKRLINRISLTYPANVEYNVIQFGGREISVAMAASALSVSPLNINFNNINQIFEKDQFLDHLSGFHGVRVLRRTDMFSTTPIDGEIIFDGVASKLLETNLTEDQLYYYTLYTYDSNFHFSDPSFIKVTPKNGNTPKGVKTFTGKVIKGSGLNVDEDVVSAWHMNEGIEDVVYDFAGNLNLSFNAIGSNAEIFWLDRSDVPIGQSGVYFPNISDAGDVHYNLQVQDSNNVPNLNQISFLAYVKKFGSSTGTIFEIEDNSSNKLTFSKFGASDIRISSGTSLSASVGFDENEWVTVGFSLNLDSGAVKLYYEGNMVSSSTITVSLSDSPYTIKLGGSSTSSFFGQITEASLHRVVRPDSYFEDFNNLIQRTDSDNGDRLVVMKYTVPSGSDYIGGNVSVVKDQFNEPANEEDGEVIYEETATVGEYIVTDNNVIPGETVNYRIFSEDLSGTFSHIKDSSLLNIDITPLSSSARQNLPTESFIPNVDGLSVISGNAKNYLKWSLDNSSGVAKKIAVHYSTESYPTVSVNSISGTRAYEGDINSTNFVHRSLINGVKYYYSVFVLDRYGRPSIVKNIEGTPMFENSDIGIPLLKIDGLSYSVNSNSSISLSWSDVPSTRLIEAYMDESISIYAKIIDEFGVLLESDVLVSPIIDVSYEYDNNVAPNVPEGETEIPELDADDLYDAVFDNFKSGFSKGLMQLRLSSIGNQFLLRNIKTIKINLKLNLQIKNTNEELVFDYTTKDLNINLLNPFSIKLANKDNRLVEKRCNGVVSVLSENRTVNVLEYNGAYIGASTDFVVRSMIQYKNSKDLLVNSLVFNLYEAIGDLCSDDELSFGELVTSGTVPVSIGNIEDIEEDGTPTGNFFDSVFADLSISVPSSPKKYLLWVESTYSGFQFFKKYLVVFESPLIIDLSTNVPVSDGISTSEQFVNVYLLDSDSPKDLSLITVPEDNTLVKWDLIKNDSSYPSRQIISNDNIDIDGGVYSYITDGVADNVFLGPISNASIIGYEDNGDPIYETHTLKATVIYDGYTASESQIVQIIPIAEIGQESAGSHFLMEFDNRKETIFSNGRNYVRATITHDPSASTTKYSDCFRDTLIELGKNIVPLESGQLVFVLSDEPDTEIIWGDVVEYVDPYTGEDVLDVSNANVSDGFASVQLSNNDFTYVYFRIKKDFSDQQTIGYNSFSTVSSCIGSEDIISYKHEINISGSVTVLSGGDLINLTAGGTIESGLPPTILIPKPALNIRAVDRRVDGDPVDNLVIDGLSDNEIILEVSYSEEAVLDGTSIEIEIDNIISTAISVSDMSISTTTFIDSNINALEARSYASLLLRPLPVNITFDSIITATVKYSISGSEEVASLCIRVKSNAEDTIGSDNSFFLDDNSSISVSSGGSDTQLTPMNTSRGFAVSEIVSNVIYVIGGINCRSILDVVEAYNIGTDTWTTLEAIPNPRMAAMSFVDGNFIYVIGGLEYDTNERKLIVSRKVDRYNTLLDIWEEMEDMPSVGSVDPVNYGVAYGTVQSNGTNAYVLCGIRDISDDGLTVIHNDRVLIYDISGDSWTYSDIVSEVDELDYKRFSPISMIDTNIVVYQGAYQNQDQTLSFKSSGFSYNVSTGDITNKDDQANRIFNRSYYQSYADDSSYLVSISGVNDKTSFYRKYLALDQSVSPTAYVEQDSLLKGRYGATSTYYSGNSRTYIMGGICSTKDNNFVRIDATISPSEWELNGKQHAEVEVVLKNNQGDLISVDVDLYVKGYVQISSVDEDISGNIRRDLLKNAVRFEDSTITAIGGKATLTLEPRSDDVLSGIINNLVFNEGVDNIRYRIVAQIMVIDDTLHGKQSVNIVDSIPSISSSLEECIDARSNITIKGLSRGINNISTYQLLPDPLIQSSPSFVDCFTSSAWMPLIEDVTVGAVEAQEAILAIESIENNSNQGCSPLLDAVNLAQKTLSSELYDNTEKNIIAFTDLENNCSKTTLEEAISAIQSIDSTTDSPFIGVNMSLISPRIMGVLERESLYSDLNILSKKTNGQVVSITDETKIDDSIGFLIGESKGSVGYGKATYVVDMMEKVSIDIIEPFFTIYDNTRGQWRVSFSDDGYNFEKLTDYFPANYARNFFDIIARYIKFEFEIFSSLSSGNEEVYENIPVSGQPKVTSIDIDFTPPKRDYIFTKREIVDKNPQQVVVVVDSNSSQIEKVKIEVGVSASDSISWDDFKTEMKQSKTDGGKIVIPLRNGTVFDIKVEMLLSNDGYVFKFPYGSVAPQDLVLLYDEAGVVIPTDKYTLYRKEGMVIFKNRQNQLIRSEIEKGDAVKSAISVTNYDSSQSVQIFGLSQFYKLNP